MEKTDKPTADERGDVEKESQTGRDTSVATLETAAVPEHTPEADSAEPVAKLGPVEKPQNTSQPSQKPAAASPARAGALAGLSLLIALLALGLSAWLFYLSRLSAVEPDSDPAADVRAELSARLQQAEQAAAGERRRLEESSVELQRTLQREVQALRSSNEERFNSLQAVQNRQRQRLLEYTTTDRSDWTLAEAEYLLRLANQRIIMAADTRSAIALLGSADGLLLELDDSDLYPVRATIAADFPEVVLFCVANCRVAPELFRSYCLLES